MNYDQANVRYGDSNVGGKYNRYNQPQILAEKTNSKNPVAVFGVVSIPNSNQEMYSSSLLQNKQSQSDHLPEYQLGTQNINSQKQFPEQPSRFNDRHDESSQNHLQGAPQAFYQPHSQRLNDDIYQTTKPVPPSRLDALYDSQRTTNSRFPLSVHSPTALGNFSHNNQSSKQLHYQGTSSDNLFRTSQENNRLNRHWTLRKPSQSDDRGYQQEVQGRSNDFNSEVNQQYQLQSSVASQSYGNTRPIPQRPWISNSQAYRQSEYEQPQNYNNNNYSNDVPDRFPVQTQPESIAGHSSYHIQNSEVQFQERLYPQANFENRQHIPYNGNDQKFGHSNLQNFQTMIQPVPNRNQFHHDDFSNAAANKQYERPTLPPKPHNYHSPVNNQPRNDQRDEIYTKVQSTRPDHKVKTHPPISPEFEYRPIVKYDDSSGKQYYPPNSYNRTIVSDVAKEGFTPYPGSPQARFSSQQTSISHHQHSPDNYGLPVKKNQNSRLHPVAPLHPFDPVEDSSDADTLDETSPSSTSRPTGFAQRKIGGFSYLPVMQPEVNKPKKPNRFLQKPLHNNMEENELTQYSRMPGDGSNSRESDRSFQKVSNESDKESVQFDLQNEKDRARLKLTGRKPPTRTKSADTLENVTDTFSSDIDTTSSNSVPTQSSPVPAPRTNATKSAANPVQKPKKLKVKNRQKVSEATQTKLSSSAGSSKATGLESKLVFKMPSEEALKRETAHPIPLLTRVPVIEGFGNTPKPKSFGADLLDHIKSAKDAALGVKKHDRSKSVEAPRRYKNPPPVKLTEEQVRMRKNTDLVMKGLEQININREDRHQLIELSRNRSFERERSLSPDSFSSANQRGRSRSRNRLSSYDERGRSKSRGKLPGPSRRNRSKSHDRLSSPNKRGRSKSQDRLSSPNRRGRSRSRDRLSSPNRRGRSKSRGRLSSLNRRGRSRSRDRPSSPYLRGRSRSRDRLSGPNKRGRSRSRDRLSSPNMRGRSRSRDRLSSPNRSRRSRSRDRLSSPNRCGRSKSRDRLSGPSRRDRSKSRDRLSRPSRHGRSKSRDVHSNPNYRPRSKSRGRYTSPGRPWERDLPYRNSNRFRYDDSYHRDRRPPAPYSSSDNDWTDYSRRVRAPDEPQVTRRAWVNDPRWRQNIGQTSGIEDSRSFRDDREYNRHREAYGYSDSPQYNRGPPGNWSRNHRRR